MPGNSALPVWQRALGWEGASDSALTPHLPSNTFALSGTEPGGSASKLQLCPATEGVAPATAGASVFVGTLPGVIWRFPDVCPGEHDGRRRAAARVNAKSGDVRCEPLIVLTLAAFPVPRGRRCRGSS